jgi:ferritin-like metal-binding protein YciE
VLAEAGGRRGSQRGGLSGPCPSDPRRSRLVSYLADAHSIEEQALTQLRAAPDIVGEMRLARIFREHLAETERHERLVRERLEAHDADPSRVKDLAGKAGGVGMVLFARSQPDTPGKLTAHAFSYEHMELAAYALLERAAKAAGDEETARVAKESAEEEQAMADRLEAAFGAAVEASLRDLEPDNLGVRVDKYLVDAHAIEKQAIQVLEAGPELIADEGLARLFREHLEETRGHDRRVTERLEQRGAKPSKTQDILLRLGGVNIGAFFGAQPDTTRKLAGFAFAFRHLEIAAYELLKRVAQKAGDAQAIALADAILAKERTAAESIASTWDRAMSQEMAEKTPAAAPKPTRSLASPFALAAMPGLTITNLSVLIPA